MPSNKSQLVLATEANADAEIRAFAKASSSSSDHGGEFDVDDEENQDGPSTQADGRRIAPSTSRAR